MCAVHISRHNLTAMPTPTPERKPLSLPQKALRKMGLLRPVDLALHLPMRYEDETQLVKLADSRDGEVIQIEAVVKSCQVVFKPRRQLQAVVDDGSDTCTLRFFNFYPNMQKALEVGRQVRLRGEVRGGFMGRTMMHPTVQAAGGALATALTPIYPSTAELPQAYLRKAVLGGLAYALRGQAFAETIPANHLPPHSWGLAQALQFLHHPTPDVSLAQLEDHTHPAWQRLKAEELLAQQLSQLQAKRERQLLNAPVLAHSHSPKGVLAQLHAALPFTLTQAQQRVVTEIANDVARAVPMHRLLQGDVGSGKTVVAALAAAQCIDAGWPAAKRKKNATPCWRWWPAAKRPWWSAPTPSFKTRCSSNTWGWPSSTSNTVLAWRSVWRCGKNSRTSKPIPQRQKALSVLATTRTATRANRIC
jgi:ATP-dependent DNA helicase RecG